jgi:hypothetical protein
VTNHVILGEVLSSVQATVPGLNYALGHAVYHQPPLFPFYNGLELQTMRAASPIILSHTP